MKNLYQFSILSLIMFMGWSCSNEDDKVIAQEGEAPELIAPEADTVILDPSNPTASALTLVWNPADYNTATQINYTVEIALSGTDFADPVNAGTTSNTSLSWTTTALNNVAITVGLIPFVQGDLDVRVTSSLGIENVMEMRSDILTLSVTPYVTQLPTIAVPGNHQGWNPPSAPLLASSAVGESDYEGYIWLDGEFKFVGPDGAGIFNWGNTDWGDASGENGSYTEILTVDDEGNIGPPDGPGYYLVKADTEDLTYSLLYIDSFAITGAATPLGWPEGPDGTPGEDHDMTYDPVSGTWSISIDLIGEQEFKFRANDAWALNYGSGESEGALIENGSTNFTVSVSGNYTVTLDMSNPRRYTYSVILN